MEIMEENLKSVWFQRDPWLLTMLSDYMIFPLIEVDKVAFGFHFRNWK